MSTAEAAELLGVSAETVRRIVDEADSRGVPVAERMRDEAGRPVKGAHRRPYRDEMERIKRRRQGETGS